MALAFVEKIKSMIERDKAVRLVANDPALTAELLLLFRTILADGKVHEGELEMFKQICAASFGLDPDAMDGVYQYLHDYSYETTSEQAMEMFSALPMERRQALLDHMIAIAEADAALDARELRLLGRTAEILNFELKKQ